ncbi:MAG: NUDIX domain-containing protein [Muribaculaceae bacterium]|nr:NUDIX domain-containing protein [Muribaculaceae bacterium]
MENTFVRVKGIIKRDGRYLLVKRWVDDHIPEPFVWEFVDAEVNHGESPDDAVLHAIHEILSIDGKIEKIEYTWSNLIGETHCIGIAYICSISEEEERNIVLAEEYGEYQWVAREQFEEFIENQYVLQDLKGKTL